MDGCEKIQARVTEIEKAAYQRGRDDMAAEIAKMLGVATSTKTVAKPKPPTKKRTNKPRTTASKQQQAVDVIAKLAKDADKLERATVNAACAARGLDKHTAGNGVKVALDRGILAKTEDMGVYVPGPQMEVSAVH